MSSLRHLASLFEINANVCAKAPHPSANVSKLGQERVSGWENTSPG
jgi:hypothetical protein